MQAKNIFLFLFCSCCLAACAPSSTPTPPAPSATPLPTATSTRTPTPAPTITPTITLTPTPIPTPSAPQIAFAANENGNWDLYRVNLDGKGLSQLTLYAGDDIKPSWSPDGLKLAYQLKQGETWQVMSMNWDGGNLVQLTNEGNNQNPTWSPDGQHILFNSDRSGNRDIYQMSPDGQNQQALSDRQANEFAPVASPDGSAIAYLSEQDVTPAECSQNASGVCPQEVFLMDASGAFLRKVVGLKANIGQIVWSPDGQSLAVVAAYFEKSEIALYDVRTQKIKPSLDFSGLLESIYQTGPGTTFLRSFSFSPKGNNGVFCSRQDVINKTGLRILYSGCYLVGMDGGVLFTLVRKEAIIYSNTDLEKAVDYSGAVWEP